jgi:SAM-dependent methyltransferase
MVLERVDVEQCEDRLQVVLHQARYDFVLARLPAGQKVLEIGTGPGTFTRQLLPKCASYTGVEYDPETCRLAREKNQGQAEIIQADARKLPFEAGRFSFIVCLEVLEHLGDWKAGVQHIHRCLTPGGTAVISVPYRRHGAKSETNEFHLYEPGELETVALFRQLFDRVEVYYQIFEETGFMTLARNLHIRRLVGLSGIYEKLSAGDPSVTDRLKIVPSPAGMKITLLLVAIGKK